MMARLMTDTLVLTTSMVESRRAQAAVQKTISAPLASQATTASNSDIAAAWLTAGVVGLGLLVALPL
jgi:hypothetical protein